jgi:putative glutamine amidotransferase
LIIISPDVEAKGVEMGDPSISLSQAYQSAIMEAGGLPLALPGLASEGVIAEIVARCDGILLTGGDDINPKLYARHVPAGLARPVTAADRIRDLRETILISELFRQRKPVFAICRGHQMLNVALGGTLVVDIARQIPGALNHERMDKKREIVHQARLTAGSLLVKITGKQSLGVNSTHHQAIAAVAGPLCITARSDDGVVEAMELKREEARLLPYLMTVQFHPERLAARYPEHQALFNCFVRACRLNRNRNL